MVPVVTQLPTTAAKTPADAGPLCCAAISVTRVSSQAPNGWPNDSRAARSSR